MKSILDRYHGRSLSGQQLFKLSKLAFFCTWRYNVIENHFRKNTSFKLVKVIKCKFSKCVSHAQKSILASWEVKIRSRSPEVIKCKFSKSIFVSSYAYIQKKSILGIMGGQNQVNITKGPQMKIFKAFWASCEAKVRSRSSSAKPQ